MDLDTQGPRIALPLPRAALCVEDDTVFDLTRRQCPLCGGVSFLVLAAVLGPERSGSTLGRVAERGPR